MTGGAQKVTDGENMPTYTHSFWAKAFPYRQRRPNCIHLLEHHLADVGACLEALLAQPTIRRRLAHAAACGCSTASANVLTASQGTSAARSAASQCAVGRDSKMGSIIANSSTAFCRLFSKVSKRGSSASSGRPEGTASLCNIPRKIDSGDS